MRNRIQRNTCGWVLVIETKTTHFNSLTSMQQDQILIDFNVSPVLCHCLLLLLVRLHDQSSSSDEVGGLLQVLQAPIYVIFYDTALVFFEEVHALLDHDVRLT